jgi:hypothetical protein
MMKYRVEGVSMHHGKSFEVLEFVYIQEPGNQCSSCNLDVTALESTGVLYCSV